MSRRSRLGVAAASLCLLACATPAFAAGPPSASGLFWWRWFAALALCLALAVGGAFALRGRVRGAPARGRALPVGWTQWLAGAVSRGGRRLQVVEVVRPSAHLEVCLIACDGQEFLLAATPNGATLLSQGAARSD